MFILSPRPLHSVDTRAPPLFTSVCEDIASEHVELRRPYGLDNEPPRSLNASCGMKYKAMGGASLEHKKKTIETEKVEVCPDAVI